MRARYWDVTLPGPQRRGIGGTPVLVRDGGHPPKLFLCDPPLLRFPGGIMLALGNSIWNEAISVAAIGRFVLKRSLFASILVIALGFSATCFLTCHRVSAATAARNLSVSVNPWVAGLTIVDQQTGNITLCTGEWAASINGAKCIKIGTVTPPTVLPTAPVGITQYIGQYYTAGTTSSAATGEVWFVNNQSGAITVCMTTNISGNLAGTCKSLGDAL